MRILSNNCIGAFLYKDYGMPYKTPLAMLQVAPSDFVKLCLDFDNYLDSGLESAESSDEEVIVKWVQVGGSAANIKFPVGKIGGEIVLFFQHSKTFEHAKEAWNRRKERYQKDKSQIYVILNLMGYARFMSNKEARERVIGEFLKLPFGQKILLHTNAEVAMTYNKQKEIIYVGEIQNSWFKFMGENPRNRKNYHRFDFDKWLKFPKAKEQKAELNPKNKITSKDNTLNALDQQAIALESLTPEKQKHINELDNAKIRIHNHLAYKLGVAMILNSKSLWGYIRMPYVLSYIKESHKIEQQKYQEKIAKNPSLKLPKLEFYPDYQEALKIKNHLSYKLGEALIEASNVRGGGANICLFAILPRSA
ncbi:DUF1919 domain-containing protein [Helicobacter sp. MIT 05-5294]|uniref:DUF1919 domain-containing protein n=1 Tax=Helicobacter sp. MIT 05-5294 TaxID=1548150 RepID=UPI0010FD5D60|nr:DUF1919 domain-containing protein [Helicobacter sp. MIT 05-5294]TLD89148.1 DUF1919 domain-containing protein [Helicobacter sp. MIT 05-5294]